MAELFKVTLEGHRMYPELENDPYAQPPKDMPFDG